MTADISETAPALTICRWAEPRDAPFAAPVFMFDNEELPEDLTQVSVVLPRGGVERARELASRNAARVLLGDAAVKDSGIIAPLAKELGEGKLGLWLPVRRMAVSWSLDSETNADFRCIAPSRVKPAWEILLSDGSRTGTDALWWAGQFLACRDQTSIAAMPSRGVSMAVIAADLTAEADLNICAEMAEQFADRLWLTPRMDGAADLRPWLDYGHIRNLVLPAGPDYDGSVLALTSEPAPSMETAAA